MKLSNYLYVIIVLCLSFTIFTYAPVLNKYWYFYFLAILLAVANRSFNRSLLVPLIAYGAILLINVYLGDFVFQNFFIATIELASLFIPVSILIYLVGRNEIKGARWIIVSFLALTIFTTIVSVGINTSNPGIIRQSTIYYSDDNAEYLRAFYSMGLSNYLLPHGLCILVPPLVLFVKDSAVVFKRVFYIISLASVIVLVYISGSTTSLLLSIISLVLSFILSPKNNVKKNYRTLMWVLIVLSPIILVSDLQLFLLRSISDLTGDTNLYQDKVAEFESLAKTGNAGLDMATRASLLLQSINEFLAHPLFGTSTAVGGHNAIIDRLAVLGIIGVIPLFVYFKRVYLWARPHFDNKIMPFVTLSVFNGCIMLFSKNMLCWEVLVSLLLIMPIMFYINTNDRLCGIIR